MLERVLPPMLGDGLVIDLRSTDYAAMWRPGPNVRDRVVAVRMLSDREGAAPALISYPSKLGKGRLARALISPDTPAATPEDIVRAWRRVGGRSGEVHPRGVDLII